MDDARAAVERLWPGRPHVVTELGGGITNRNFKVSVGGEDFVLRMGGAKTSELGIDRAVENAAGRRAHEVGVGPEVIAFLPSEGWLVARFVDGRPIPVGDMRRPEMLSRVAGALRRFHEAAAIPGRFDAYEVVDDYRRKAEAHGVAIPPEFDEARAIAQRIRAARGRQPEVPCHNDLLNANFLEEAPPPEPHNVRIAQKGRNPREKRRVLRKTNRILIVDWEYAGMGDRFFDLANFSVNHEFSVDDDRRLLEAYFGEARQVDLASLRLMRFMSDFREAMWGVLQSGISELDFDFRSYAAEHFGRMTATASEPEFDTYIFAFRRRVSGSN